MALLFPGALIRRERLRRSWSQEGLCITFAAGFTMLVCWGTIWKNRRAVRAVYEAQGQE